MLIMFLGRSRERAELHSRLASNQPQLMLLYGRRRLGKTALLRDIRRKVGGLYFRLPDQGEAGILKHLNQRLQAQVDRPIQYASISDFLMDLASHGQRFVILDQVQRLFDANPRAISLLQAAWDTTLKDSRIALALCGSVIGTLEGLVDAKSPLYGRFTYVHHLAPFTYAATRQFYPGHEESQRLHYYAVFGATPHYHEINLQHTNVLAAIQASFLDRGAPLRDEPRTLFASEFRNPARYHELLEAMGRGARSLGEVGGYYGRKSTDYTAYFEVLRDRLQVVRAADPLGGRKRKKRIDFEDIFFRFYYRHIYPNMDRIELGDPTLLKEIEDALPDLVGRAWETVCKEWMVAMQGKIYDGVAIQFRQLGSWWDGENKMDVVALGENTLYAGECLFMNRPVSRGHLEGFLRRASTLKVSTKLQNMHLFFWTKSRPNEAATAFAKENAIHILRVADVVAGLESD